jgi:cyclophilin family peptidyl-prolyl cis-trans isomerase
MMTSTLRLALTCLGIAVSVGAVPTAAPQSTPAPIVVIETAKGTIELELFPADAPKSVAHIVSLLNRNFYRGQRIHRAERTLVQFGDPGTRDMSRMDSWGSGNSGQPIGVAEFSKRTHQRGAVGLAHGGNAKYADSQIYIMKTASPALDGKHAVIGRVLSGMDVVDKLEKADPLRRVSLKAAAPK